MRVEFGTDPKEETSPNGRASVLVVAVLGVVPKPLPLNECFARSEPCSRWCAGIPLLSVRSFRLICMPQWQALCFLLASLSPSLQANSPEHA